MAWAMLTAGRAWDVIQFLQKLAEEEKLTLWAPFLAWPCAGRGCTPLPCLIKLFAGSRLAWAMLTGGRAWDIIQCLRKLAEEEGLQWLGAAFARCDLILHAHPYSTRAFYGSRLNRLKLRALHGATDPQAQCIIHVSLHPDPCPAHVMRSSRLCQGIRPLQQQESAKSAPIKTLATHMSFANTPTRPWQLWQMWHSEQLSGSTGKSGNICLAGAQFILPKRWSSINEPAVSDYCKLLRRCLRLKVAPAVQEAARLDLL